MKKFIFFRGDNAREIFKISFFSKKIKIYSTISNGIFFKNIFQTINKNNFKRVIKL